MGYKEFLKEIKNVKKERHHKVTNSYGSKDAFKYYRKIKPSDSKYVLTDCEYLKIIRSINNCLREKLLNGEDVLLPERMGRLELRKTKTSIKFVEGKLVTNLPVNWDATLNLWYNNETCLNKKQLVREDISEIFRVYYNKQKANYNNKIFYKFNTNRELKVKLKTQIKHNKIDAFAYGN